MSYQNLLLSDPDVQKSYRLQKTLHNLYEAGTDWKVACAGIGNTLADADPYMELILAKLGMAALYNHRNRLTGKATMTSVVCFAPPEYAFQIREWKDECQQEWIPVCWYVMNEIQKHMVIRDAKQRIVEMEQMVADRLERIRLNKKEMKQRLSLEMKQILEELERNKKNPHWLAQQLKTRYGADDIDTDKLPLLSELQERYERAEEQENETIRRATLAPVPGNEPDNILMFEMDFLEQE